MFKKILLAADGSPASLRAAKVAGELARQLPEAHLTILHVLHVPPLLQSGMVIEVPLDPMIRNTARPILDATADATELPADRIRKEVQIGDPSMEIVDMARTEQMDVVVIGTRGLSPLKELLLGSVSHQVLHMAPCPVLLIH